MAQRRGRQAALLVEPQHLVEALDLHPGIAQIQRVRVGEVRINALHFQVLAAQRRLQEALGAVVMHADALHAGIHLEMHLALDPHLLCRLIHLVQLLDRGGRDRQVVAQEARRLVAQDAPQHQDRRGDAALAQQDALFQHRHANAIGPQLLHQPRHLHQPMPVGIGLQDRHHPRRGHVLADGAEVLGQPPQVDLHHGWPHHLVAADGWMNDRWHA